MEVLQRQFRAPEVYGDFWFNSEPISVGALRGFIIMLDFWDFTSLGSLHSLAYVQEWHRRYADLGLVVVGVHTPMFPFARDPQLVKRAIDRFGVRYPVVLDNDYIVWSAYGIRSRPTKLLINKNGYVSHWHGGEGPYYNFEHAIQSLLVESGYRADFPLVMEPLRETDAPGAICYRPTPEILVGYQRGGIGNVEGCFPESTASYSDPGLYLEGRVYLSGEWLCERDLVRHAANEGEEGSLVLTYQAREAHAVMAPEGERGFQVFVMQDDLYLTSENRGEDVRIDHDGRSYLLIGEPRLYNVVKNREFGEHVLRLSSRSGGFAFYAVAFASALMTDLVSEN